MEKETNREKVVLAGGCFWCTEAIFKSLKGVVSATPGYTGGEMDKPTYQKVSTGETGHAEAILLEYDPTIINFRDLLNVFFHTHNPTTLNQQGNDIGEQYRSAIFYTTNNQKEEIEKFINQLKEAKAYDRPIVTEVEPFKNFFPAEDYHQDYYAKNQEAPYCELVIAPKLEKLNNQFSNLMKKQNE